MGNVTRTAALSVLSLGVSGVEWVEGGVEKKGLIFGTEDSGKYIPFPVVN
jgi:hypothetical protein